MYATLAPLLLEVERSEGDDVVVDLSGLMFASTGAMVPLIALAERLRTENRRVTVVEPTDPLEAEYCRKAGWIDALQGDSPEQAQWRRRTFLPIARFQDHIALNEAVTAALEVVTSVAVYPPGVLRAVEWVVNELADNVLVHAGAGVAGWMQVIANPQVGRLSFTVADTGRGILESLREQFPDLVDDAAALNMAIQPGVTRSTQIGQGNGLSGSVRIAETMHGWLNLMSGGADYG
jgi:anti-sigma regulatory factor (Ser/Thr protein kinase)